MLPIDNLIHEHNAIKVMLDIMSKIADNIYSYKGFDINDIEKIVDFLKTFADKCHHAKEETVLFPTLLIAGIHKENGPIGVILHEHAIGREIIKELNTGVERSRIDNNCYSELIASSLTNYVKLLQNHIQKEENILFPLVNKILNEQQQMEITLKFEKIEEKIIRRGAHEPYHEILEFLKIKYLNVSKSLNPV
jgi:hemerythrin-like domain-containing protein